VLVLDVPEVRADELVPEDIPLEVVYRDDDVIVVDKPAGLVTHPAPGHERGTLVNALLALESGERGLASVAGVERPGIVHRLDRDTSGLIVVARNDAAQVSLQAQLKARRVRKTYLALVGGMVNAQLGRIEKPIGRDPGNRMRMAVTAEGKPAVTGYRVRERFDEWTLLDLDLVTGRTHQIRVHLASIGHPVAGDAVYAKGVVRRGPRGLERMFLHAWKLEFVSPGSGRLVRCEAPLPEVLETVLDGLRAGDAGGS
jgi:23S rRNA pseudouridine1911/1915/1917 synthase